MTTIVKNFLSSLFCSNNNTSKTKTILTIAATATAATTLTAVASFFLFIKLSKAPSRMHWRSLIFGHRGCRHIPGVPENTINSIQYYIDHTRNSENNKGNVPTSKFAGVEFDVRLCKSGELVVFHDAFCVPLFDVNHYNAQLFEKEGSDASLLPLDTKIIDLTLHQLRQLPYRDDSSKSIRVCTAEEALKFCQKNNLKVLLELKGTPGRVQEETARLLDLYRDHQDKAFVKYMLEETTVISFQPFVLYHLRKGCPQVATFQLMRRDAASLLTGITTQDPPKGGEPAIIPVTPSPFPKNGSFVKNSQNNLVEMASAFPSSPGVNNNNKNSSSFQDYNNNNDSFNASTAALIVVAKKEDDPDAIVSIPVAVEETNNNAATATAAAATLHQKSSRSRNNSLSAIPAEMLAAAAATANAAGVCSEQNSPGVSKQAEEEQHHNSPAPALPPLAPNSTTTTGTKFVHHQRVLSTDKVVNALPLDTIVNEPECNKMALAPPLPILHETVPASWAKYPKLFDQILWIMFNVAPFIHGSSGVSPSFNQMNAKERSWWAKSGFMVYLWGFVKPEDFSEDMKKDQAICIAMDDEYGSYVFL